MIAGLRHIFFFTLVLISFSACTKGGDETDDSDGGPHIVTPNDVTPPEISIFTPTVNQVFSSGSVINITGRVTDDYGLYRGTIRVVNDVNGSVLLNQPYEIHGFLLYNFNLNHTASVNAASDYTVTVTFEDHGLNSATKSVKVKVNP
jgi:hypothetical protein